MAISIVRMQQYQARTKLLHPGQNSGVRTALRTRRVMTCQYVLAMHAFCAGYGDLPPFHPPILPGGENGKERKKLKDGHNHFDKLHINSLTMWHKKQ
jgi:hypothetical protein